MLSENLCPEILCTKYKVKVETGLGHSYDFKDASGNKLRVTGEANLFVQLPGETKRRYLRGLVMSSWTHPTLIIGLEMLRKWDIVSDRFPLPLEREPGVLSVEEQPQGQ